MPVREYATPAAFRAPVEAKLRERARRLGARGLPGSRRHAPGPPDRQGGSVCRTKLSVTNGHGIMPDMPRRHPPALTRYLDRLRDLPFVRRVDLAARPDRQEVRGDGILKVRTPRGTFTLALDVKGAFLDRGLANAAIGEHRALVRAHGFPLLLVAPYIPRPTGERLAEAGVNFVDRHGNIHLTLGDDHHVLILGRRPRTVEATGRRPGPALVQLYFLLLAESAAVQWPVRRLADEAGIGKTAAADALRRLVRLGVLARDRKGGYGLADQRRLQDDFLRAYADVLRPHLEIGRFRAPEQEPDTLLRRLAGIAATEHLNWAITGGPAAYALDRFYRGPDVVVFIEGFTQTMQRALRFVPDREGPITVLRPFGRRWVWKAVADLPVTHPWLVYAELLRGGDPRAADAAEQIRERFLTA